MVSPTRPIISTKEPGQVGQQFVTSKKSDGRFMSHCSGCKAISQVYKISSNSKRPSSTFPTKLPYKCIYSSSKFSIAHTVKPTKSTNNFRIYQMAKKKWTWRSQTKPSSKNTNASLQLRTASKWYTRGCKIKGVDLPLRARLDIPPQFPANKPLQRMDTGCSICLKIRITRLTSINNTTWAPISHKRSRSNSNIRIFSLEFSIRKFLRPYNLTHIRIRTRLPVSSTISPCTSNNTSSRFRLRLSKYILSILLRFRTGPKRNHSPNSQTCLQQLPSPSNQKKRQSIPSSRKSSLRRQHQLRPQRLIHNLSVRLRARPIVEIIEDFVLLWELK